MALLTDGRFSGATRGLKARTEPDPVHLRAVEPYSPGAKLRDTISSQEEAEERRLWADYYEAMARALEIMRTEGTIAATIARVLAEHAAADEALARIKEIRAIPWIAGQSLVRYARQHRGLGGRVLHGHSFTNLITLPNSGCGLRDGPRGTFYIATPASTGGEVWIADAIAGTATLLAYGVGNPCGIAYDRSHRVLYVRNQG